MAKVKVKPEEIILEYVKGLQNKIRINKVILFGSAVRNRVTRDSDLDLIVLSDSFRGMDFLRRLELLSRARSNLSRSVAMDILGYTPAEFKKISKESVVLGEAKREGRIIWPLNP